MLIIPAIDLQNNAVVRLTQGDPARATTYHDDPQAVCQKWLDAGCERLHVVDLDGAFAGAIKNRPSIERIVATCQARGVPVQIGGGIRDVQALEGVLALGVEQVILGTAVIENPDFLKAATEKNPGRIILSVDAKDGEVFIKGWKAGSGKKIAEVLKTLEKHGLSACFALIYTDIAKDGTLQGPNLAMLAEVQALSPVPLIAAGGISTLGDLQLLQKDLPGIFGAITGRAIYQGTLNLADAIAWSRR